MYKEAVCKQRNTIQSLNFLPSPPPFFNSGCTFESFEELKNINSPISGVFLTLGLDWLQALEVFKAFENLAENLRPDQKGEL